MPCTDRVVRIRDRTTECQKCQMLKIFQPALHIKTAEISLRGVNLAMDGSKFSLFGKDQLNSSNVWLCLFDRSRMLDPLLLKGLDGKMFSIRESWLSEYNVPAGKMTLSPHLCQWRNPFIFSEPG